MFSKLFDKPKAEDGLLGGMVQNVQSDQAGVKILIASFMGLGAFIFPHFVIEIRYRWNTGGCQDR
jgi:hypothetical protein